LEKCRSGFVYTVSKMEKRPDIKGINSSALFSF
jgi:hypothetical protein